MTRPWFWGLAMLLPCVAAAQSPSFASRCEARVSPSPVTVLSTPVSYTMDTGLPHREIARLAGPAKAGAYVLGLTKARFNTRIGYRATVATDRDTQQECVVPVLTVTLAYPSVVVYIGSEFPEGSCAYREILVHELQHVQAFQQHMAELEASVRQAMGERFSKPIYGTSGQALTALAHEINTVWKPFILAEQRKVELLQKQIDTAEESRRVIRSCGGEVRRALQESRVEKPIPTGE